LILEWGKEEGVIGSSLLFIEEREKRRHVVIDADVLEKRACRRHRTDV
jgi:hypothetical protein